MYKSFERIALKEEVTWDMYYVWMKIIIKLDVSKNVVKEQTKFCWRNIESSMAGFSEFSDECSGNI